MCSEQASSMTRRYIKDRSTEIASINSINIEFETGSLNEHATRLCKLTNSKNVQIVRVTYDGTVFHPAEGLFRKVLPTYYSVIVWDGTFAHREIFYYSAFTIANSFRNKLL